MTADVWVFWGLLVFGYIGGRHLTGLIVGRRQDRARRAPRHPA